MNPQEKLADDGEAEIQRARQELTSMVRLAAHKTYAAIVDGSAGARTGELADLAYAVACLEAVRRGVLPGTPPPKYSAPAEMPPRRPTGSPQPDAGYPPFGDTTRTNR